MAGQTRRIQGILARASLDVFEAFFVSSLHLDNNGIKITFKESWRSFDSSAGFAGSGMIGALLLCSDFLPVSNIDSYFVISLWIGDPLDESLTPSMICLKRDQSLHTLWKNAERREQGSLKGSEVAEKLQQLKETEEQVQFFQLPFQWKGIPVDLKQEKCWRKPFTESFPEAEIVAPAAPEITEEWPEEPGVRELPEAASRTMGKRFKKWISPKELLDLTSNH